jgi:transposase
MRSFGVAVQFCLAHLISEVKFLTTLPDLEDALYGTRLLMALEDLFGLIHRREQLGAEEFARQLAEARARVLASGMRDEGTPHSRRMAKRMARYGEAYFTLVTTPGVEPTNNLAEQAIRFVVIDRLVTQGTRSQTGQRWSERIWPVLASCAQQGREAFAYLQEAVQAHFAGGPAPSLLGPAG